MARHELRCTGKERPRGGEQRTDDAVTREPRGAQAVRCELREQGVLEWQKDADVAARRVQRADDRDHQQRPEVGRDCKAEAGGRHQCRGGEQQRAEIEAMRVMADDERQRSRAQQRARRDDADLERRESERQQVHRQQQADEAVPERAKPARNEQAA